MKRTGIRRPTYEEALAKARQKALKARENPRQPKPRKPIKKRAQRQIGTKKKKSEGVPSWIRAIPEGSHGSGTYQKRLWKLVSDYVRIRDWYKYGTCAATGKRIEHWSEGHGGHLKPYTGCYGLFKFDVRNIHLQHGNSNKFGNFDTFRDMEKEVRRRGYDFDAFERENEQARGCSLRNPEVVEEMERVLTLMQDLPERPQYFERVMMLRETL